MKTLVGWIITIFFFIPVWYLYDQSFQGEMTMDEAWLLSLPILFLGLIVLGLTGNLYKED